MTTIKERRCYFLSLPGLWHTHVTIQLLFIFRVIITRIKSDESVSLSPFIFSLFFFFHLRNQCNGMLKGSERKEIKYFYPVIFWQIGVSIDEKEFEIQEGIDVC